ncbi:MAG TPA: hypothetical protein VFW73_03150 [Lacipirellulaceae bacterium]|nr:hypothetical protein [Lacipirellulaceae bacterium]
MADDPRSLIPNTFGAYLQPPQYHSTARVPPNGFMGAGGKLAFVADSFLSGLSRGRALKAAHEAEQRDMLYKGIYNTIAQVQQSDAAQPVKEQALKQLTGLQVGVLQNALGGDEKGSKRGKKSDQGQDQNHPGFHILEAVKGIVNSLAGPGGGKPVDTGTIVNTLNAVRASVFDPKNSQQAFLEKIDVPVRQAYAAAVRENGGKPPTWSFLTSKPYFMKAYASALSMNGGKITPALSGIMSSSEELQKEQANLTEKTAVQQEEDRRQQSRLDYELNRQQAMLKKEEDIANKREEEETKRFNARMKATGGGRGGSRAQDIDAAGEVAQGIQNGTQPPTLNGMYHLGAYVRADLARNGYNLAQATRDWNATNAHLRTLNGAQMTRMMTALNSLDQMIPQLREAYDKWQATGLPGGYKDYNKVALIAAAHGSGPSSGVAQNLLTLINDTASEMSYVYMGGNSPTDHALNLAESNLKGNWNAKTFDSSLELLQKNLQIRRNSIMTSPVIGISQNSPYATHPASAPTPTAPAATPAPPGAKLDPKVQGLLSKYQSVTSR